MKRKFIFLAMLLLTLVGGVKWNVLNAQEPGIKIGEDKQEDPTGMYPMYGSWYCSISQQIFTAAEIGVGAGNITSIAFKTSTAAKDHNITVWLLNTTNSTLDSPMAFGDSDKVFEGTWNSGAVGTWSQITLDRAFSYNGDNLVVILQENGTGSTDKFYKYTKGAGTTLQYKYASYVASLEGLSGYYTSTYNNVFGLTIESGEVVPPSVPKNLTATAINHASIELTWDAAENAKKYNIYKNGEKTGTTTEVSYIVKSLDPETTYNFTVTAVNGSEESAHSESVSATTLEYKDPLAGKYFRLKALSYVVKYENYYSGTTSYTAYNFSTPKYLNISSYNTNDEAYINAVEYAETPEQIFTFEPTGTINEYYLRSTTGYYIKCYQWNMGAPSKDVDNASSFRVSYIDDTETTFQLMNGRSSNEYIKVEQATDYSYKLYCDFKEQEKAAKWVVEEVIPSVETNYSEIKFGDVQLGEYWSERTEHSYEFNVTAMATTIKSISCDNNFFTFTPALSEAADKASFNTKVSYDKEAEAGAKSGNIVVTYMNGETEETIEIPISATAYTPVKPDVIELAQDVEFTAGAYTNTPDFATLHDDYILPGEATEGNTPDAVYHFTMENEGTLTVNVTGTNAIAAVYKADDMKESGPMANNNYKGIVAGPTAPTTFFNGFESGDFTGWTLLDRDNDGNNWEIINGGYGNSSYYAISHSYKSPNDLYPENYLITDTRYYITENSKLSVCATSANKNWLDGFNIEISENGTSDFEVVATITATTVNNLVPIVTDLSKYAGKEVYIAINHNTDARYYLYIDNIELTDGSAKSRSLARNAEPQINGVQFPAGEYYLVAAAEDAFTVSIETASLPEPGEFAYTAPADGATEQNNPKLTWEAAQYAVEYKVYLGTSSTLTEENLVATVATPSYQTEGLSNNTQYFWRVDAVNETGTQEGAVYSFVTPLNQATELAVTDAELYPGETTTLTWTAAESALYYNIYVNEELAAESEETSFELTNLPHNVNPGNAITVTAVHTLGESAHSEAVYVKMAGEFNLVVNVKDAEGNAIENAAVAFNTESNYGAYYDEYNQLVPAIDTLYTDAEGKVTQTLAMPCVPSSPDWIYSYLEVVISKEYATSKSFGITAYTEGLSAGQNYVKDITLEYVAPQNVKTDKDFYVEGENMIFTWNEVEGAVGYNVYKVGYDDVYTLVNEEAITETTFTVENLKYDLKGPWVIYAVTADYGFVESAKNAKVYPGVTGEGQIAVTVTDGTNPIKGATVTLVGPDGFDRQQTYTFVTNEEGKITGDMLIGSYYTATVSHYDYNEKVMEEDVAIEYQTELSLDIVLEAKPSVEDITVIATDNGDYANVTWTGSYEKYNVYRRNMDNPQEVELLGEATASPYTDNEWAELEDGTYQYGVSTFVEEQAQSRGTEVIFEEGFENVDYYKTPSGWKIIGNYSGAWYVYNAYKYSGEKALWSYYMMSGTYDILMPGSYNPSGTTLSFYHLNKDYQGTSDELVIYWTTSPEGTYDANNVLYTSSATTWTKAEISLNDIKESSIYIGFRMNSVYADGIYIDDITITREAASAKESQITWSNELVKKSALTFNNAAGDNDWSNVVNWNSSVLPTANDNVIIAAEANINGTVAVNNLTISNARLNVKSGALTVNGTITDSNQYGSLYFEDGAQIFQNNEGVNAYFRMNVKNPTAWEESNINGWQFISSPLLGADIASAATKYDNAYQPSDYDLYKYNGAAELEWVNHKSGNFESTFEQGRGYMYSHQARTIVTLGGTLNPATTHEYEVTYTEDKELANFHLLGNPFSFNMDWSNITVKNVYEAFATVDPSTGGYVNSIKSGVTTIPVGDGFFVEAIGENPSISYNAGSKSRGEKVEYINVVASGKQGSNNVIIKLSGKEEKGFSKLENLNQSIADIYVKNNGRQYSVLGYDNDVKEVELFFDAKEMGNYTISLDVNGEFETVTLVDRFTGIETNMLLEDEYTFTATSNDNVNRFVIRLANGQEPTANSQFVYQSGEELILSIEGTVQIVDMLGRVVYYNEHANGDNRINVAEFNDAAYVVRVVNEEGVKTQKVVIY